MTTDTALHIVTALPAEAHALIQRLRLRRQSDDTAFAVFCGQDCRLIVSGVGRINAAAATTWLQARYGQQQDIAWLNVGIAGHALLPIGSGHLIHRISDPAGQCWYPPRVFPWRGDSQGLRCVDNASSDYPRADLVDMESAAFFATANRFATAELVQCYKVVSDNRLHPPGSHLNATRVRELMAAVTDEILELAAPLRRLSCQWRQLNRPPEHFDSLLEQGHFTVNQRHQLRESLRCLAVHGLPLPETIHQQRQAKAILRLLNEQLQTALRRVE